MPEVDRRRLSLYRGDETRDLYELVLVDKPLRANVERTSPMKNQAVRTQIVNVIGASLVVSVLTRIVTGERSAGLVHDVPALVGSALAIVLCTYALSGILLLIYWIIRRKPMEGVVLAVWRMWAVVSVLIFLGRG